MKLALHRLMKLRGIKQNELASEIPISTGYMSLLLSGKRNPSPETLVRMAEVLQVSVGELFEGTVPPGFAESSVEPYEPAQSNSANTIAQALAPGIRHPALYRCSRNMPDFGLRAGDVLIVDKSATPHDGDLVVVVEYDPETDLSQTELRRLATPWIVGDVDSDEPLIDIGTDDQKRAIHGVLVASARAPGLLS